MEALRRSSDGQPIVGARRSPMPEVADEGRLPLDCEGLMGNQAAGLDLDMRDHTAIVRPWGVLDLGGSAVIRPLMDEAADSAASHFLFDLDRVSFLDGSGLQELLRFNAAVRQRGKRLSIINSGAQVRRLFLVTGSNRELDVLPA